MESAHKDKR